MSIVNLTEREGKTILKYLIPTDRRKNAADILLDAILNIWAGIAKMMRSSDLGFDFSFLFGKNVKKVWGV